MNDKTSAARRFLHEFKGENYIPGLNCFAQLGGLTRSVGRRVSVVASGFGKSWGGGLHERIRETLKNGGVELAGEITPGCRPNAPVEDVLQIRDALAAQAPEAIVAVGGGSVIDAVKAATALLALGGKHPEIEEYYGVGKVSRMLAETGAKMLPIVAVQLAASSAAHLTKYANITHLQSAQKKLIIDEAVVPCKALFDYALTTSMSPSFTADGALDGMSHALEVFMGLSGDALCKTRPVSLLAIKLVVNHLKAASRNGADLEAREALGLATDLGGYCIMIGGTNGAHLASFSLVDILSHGRACALMNPYYVVFFAPAIEPQLREVAAILAGAGYLKTDFGRLKGRGLGLAVAEAMIALSSEIGFPTRLADVEGFTDAHITRALSAAKNPQLESKLKNMPVPLSAATVEEYMGPVLEAAKTGDFSLIRNMR